MDHHAPAWRRAGQGGRCRSRAGSLATLVAPSDADTDGSAIDSNGDAYPAITIKGGIVGPFDTGSSSNEVTEADLAQGSIYPALSRIREVSARIGAAVAKVAYDRGLARGARPRNLLSHVRATMFDPRY